MVSYRNFLRIFRNDLYYRLLIFYNFIMILSLYTKKSVLWELFFQKTKKLLSRSLSTKSSRDYIILNLYFIKNFVLEFIFTP